MTPPRDLGGFFEWQIQAPKVDDQAQVLDICVSVIPV
jgi:hypothetical protein